MNQDLLNQIRTAVGNYIYSEGCGCCQHENHDEHAAALAKLIGVEPYSDNSGYQFLKYCSK